MNWTKKVTFQSEKYMLFRVFERQGDWARVEDQEGDIVWIHQPLLWIR